MSSEDKKEFIVMKQQIKKIREKKDNIKAEVEKDVEVVAGSGLLEECRNSSNITQKYLEWITSFRRPMRSKEIELMKIEGELIYYYRGEREMKDGKYGKSFSMKLSSSDVEKMIHQDPKYYNLLELVNELKEIVKYLEEIIWNLKDRKNALRNIIDLMKLQEIT